MEELAGVALILAIPLGARAVLELAWYRYRHRTIAATRIGWGQDSFGLPRPVFLGAAAGAVLAATAFVAVVAIEFGAREVFRVLFLAIGALLLITLMTAIGVLYGKWVGRLWWRRATRGSNQK